MILVSVISCTRHATDWSALHFTTTPLDHGPFLNSNKLGMGLAFPEAKSASACTSLVKKIFAIVGLDVTGVLHYTVATVCERPYL